MKKIWRKTAAFILACGLIASPFTTDMRDISLLDGLCITALAGESLQPGYFDFTAPAELVYHDHATAATVTPKADYAAGMGEVTVYYKNTSSNTNPWTTDAPKNAGTYQVGIKVTEGSVYSATGDYLFSSGWQFTIEPAEATGNLSDISMKEKTYTGKEIIPEVYTAKCGGYTFWGLERGIDYDIEWVSADKVNAGVKEVNVIFKGNYTGSFNNKKFEVNVVNLSDVFTISVTPSHYLYAYDGTEKKPTITVTNKDLAADLTEGTDYTISYTSAGDDFTNVGSPKVSVKGIGNYGGTVSCTYDIYKAPTARTPFCNGSAVQLINAGTVGTDSSIKYAVNQSETEAPAAGWETDASKITADSAGTYYVWYKVRNTLVEEPVKVIVSDQPEALVNGPYKQTADSNGKHYTRFVYVVPKSDLTGKSKVIFSFDYEGRTGNKPTAEKTEYYTGITTNGMLYTPASDDSVMLAVTVSSESVLKNLTCEYAYQ